MIPYESPGTGFSVYTVIFNPVTNRVLFIGRFVYSIQNQKKEHGTTD